VLTQGKLSLREVAANLFLAPVIRDGIGRRAFLKSDHFRPAGRFTGALRSLVTVLRTEHYADAAAVDVLAVKNLEQLSASARVSGRRQPGRSGHV
jgi:hypothetical protein